jgi:hypothetical protein
MPSLIEGNGTHASNHRAATFVWRTNWKVSCTKSKCSATSCGKTFELGYEGCIDIALRLSIRQLCNGHSNELVRAQEVIDLVFNIAIEGTEKKRAQWHEESALRKIEAHLVHWVSC